MLRILLALIFLSTNAFAYQYVYNPYTGKQDNIGPASPMSSVSGNVGIGSTAPACKLDLGSGDVCVAGVPVGGGGGGTPGGAGTNLQYRANSSTFGGVSGSSVVGNNIGIGSAAPGTALDVAGTVRATTLNDLGLTASRPVISDASKNLASGTYSGNTTSLATTTGTLTSGNLVKWDASGNAIASGTSLGTLTDTKFCTYDTASTSIVCNTSGGTGTINSGTTNRSARYTGSTTLDSSTKIFDDGTNVGIGTIAPRSAVELGVQALNVVSSNIGIGTFLPNQVLDVAGNIRLSNANRTIDTGTSAANGYDLTVQGGAGLGAASGAGGALNLNSGAGNGSGNSGALSLSTPNSVTTSGTIALLTGTGNTSTGAITLTTGNSSVTASGISLATGTGVTSGAITLNTGAGSVTNKHIALQNTSGNNVGVGTSSPASKLAVLGGVGIGSKTYAVDNSAPSNGLIVEGNVGIGSLAPGKALDVNGTVRMMGFQMNNGVTNNYVLTTDGSGNGTWKPASGGGSSQWITTTNVGIGTTDNVGVGTITPTNALTVTGNASIPQVDLNENNIPGGIDSNAVLVLHDDGTNGSTTITDSALTPHTMTAQGDAQLSTTSPKFGTAALLLDGTGDYVSTPSSTDFDMAAGDFTYETWVKTATSGTVMTIFHRTISGGNDQIKFNIDASDKLNFVMQDSGSNLALYATTSAVSIADSAWHAIALVRNGASLFMFVDGVSQTLTTTNAIGTNSMVAGTSVLAIGARTNAANAWNGRFDETRITKGLARYTSNYTPATQAFAVSSASAQVNFKASSTSYGAIGASALDSSFQIVPATVGTSPILWAGFLSGNVGIGSSNPGKSLDVQGGIRGTSFNNMAVTSPASTSTLAVANNKTFTVNNTLTLSGTDSTTMTFPSTSATIARTDASNTFTGHQTIEGVTSTGATGTGKFVFDTSPTISSPVITNIAPAADFTLTQNSVAAVTSVNSGAVVNTLYLKTGNVGIGSTNPGKLLDVQGTVRAQQGYFSNSGPSEFDSNVGIGTSLTPLNMLGVSGGVVIGTTNAGYFVAPSNGLLVQGNVGIGSTAPQATLDLGTSGTMVSHSTSGIGASVKTGANTACNTTCGSSACIFGFDTGLGGTDVVNCASALADTCLCLGP